MKLIPLIFFSFIFLLSCHKQHVDKSAPACIKNKIDSFSKTCCNSNAVVDEYNFQGNTVYLFGPGNCGADMTSPVYDKDCNLLGLLGGYAGNTKINGEDFSKAQFIKNIWKN